MEAAIVLPVIILVVMGTMEIGLAFKDYLTVGSLSREGARIAALAGGASDADCVVLKGLGELATQGDLDRIIEIQIYEAAEGTGNQSVTNTNKWVYNPGEDPTECNIPAGIDDGWTNTNGQQFTGTERNTTIGANPLTIVGVRIQLDHDWATGFPPFRGDFTIDESTIARVEPQAFD